MIPAYVFLVYFLGFIVSFIARGCHEEDGHDLFGCAMLWPAFAVREVALCLMAGVGRLFDQS